MADLDELIQLFRSTARDHCSRSPFQAHLWEAIADEPDLVAVLQSAPEEQRLPVLLAAAIHWLVLSEPDLELAQYYPTCTDEPLTGNLVPALRSLCHDRADELRALVATRHTQTNEVGRAALFLPALAVVADEHGPISLVDVGTSAGLNLLLDRFAYRYEPGGEVGMASPVVLECGTRGNVPVPAEMPAIADRIGLDRTPVDLTSEEDERWLMACVWPDQHDRFARLRAALELAHDDPPTIRRTEAAHGVTDAVEHVGHTGHPVVLNSWVLNYFTADERAAYLAALDHIGRSRDLSWVTLESPALCPGIPFAAPPELAHLTAVTLTTWRRGERATRHLGTAHPHGYWLHWHDA